MSENIRPAIKGQEGWYPLDKDDCLFQIRDFLERDNNFLTKTTASVGGIVPHAGWFYSGDLALKTIELLAKNASEPQLILLFGVDHRGIAGQPCLCNYDAWETPFGPLKVDKQLGSKLVEEFPDLFIVENAAHQYEHSIEIQLPFLAYFFKDVKILPIAVPCNFKQAERCGESLATLFEDRKVLVFGSTDLTHYGLPFAFAPKGLSAEAGRWVKEELDPRILTIMENLEVEKVIPEVSKNQNACGAGPIVAALSYFKKKNLTRGELVGHTSSLDRGSSVKKDFSHFVSYGALVF
ncbi:AmmeMemoRadiSam system protein B [Candidatus Riflebacteria bacterium]